MIGKPAKYMELTKNYQKLEVNGMKTIKELDEHCRRNNKRIIVRRGIMVGIIEE